MSAFYLFVDGNFFVAYLYNLYYYYDMIRYAISNVLNPIVENLLSYWSKFKACPGAKRSLIILSAYIFYNIYSFCKHFNHIVLSDNNRHPFSI